MKINGLDVVTLDFETYYGTGYTLRTMSTTDYIHNHKFKIHMVGIKRGSGKTQVYHGHLGAAVALANIDWSKTALLCHNTQFDGYILYYHFGIHPAMYLDTLAMARGVHSHHIRFDLDTLGKLHGREGKKEKDSLVDSKNMIDLINGVRQRMAVYCAQDVDLTFDIFNDLREVLPESELKVIDIFIRMACWPILKVNVPRLLKHKKSEEDKNNEAVASCGATKDELVSNDKFAAKLRELGCEPPTKTSPRTGLETYAFSKADLNFQALAKHKNPEVRKLYEARRVCKSSIEQTRTQRFLDITHNGRLPLPVFLNYGAAHTLRSSGGNKLNLQNLTRGGELRRSIYVDPDEVIVVADYAQIEARLTAWLAGLTEQLAAFAAGEDVYKIMATKIYGVKLKDVTKEQRFIAKCAVLGLGFQMGATRFQNVLETGALGPAVFMPLDMCEKVVHGYRNSNPGLAFIWNLMGHILFCMKEGIEGSYKSISWGRSHVMLPNGQRLHYPGLKGTVNAKEPWGQRRFSPTLEDASYHGKHGPQKIFPGYLLENIIQALARIIVTDAMVRIDDKKMMDIASMTHDEIIGVTGKNIAPRVYNQVVAEMTKPLSWAPGMPLSAEGGWSRNYSK